MRTLYGANKAERLAARAIYIPKDAKLVPGPAGGAVYAYNFTGKDGRERFAALFFWGSSAKPTQHISYCSERSRAEAVAQWHANIRNHAERKAKTSADKAAWVNPLKVGTILHSSWGYDQTNVDFFAVTKVSGRRIWLRMIAADYEATGYMSGNTWPAMPIRFIDAKGEPEGDAWSRLMRGHETMHIAQPSGAEGVYVKISDCIHAWPAEPRSYNTTSYA